MVGAIKDYVLKNYHTIPIDVGPDFYAPQTLLTPDGRRMLIAWMPSWKNFIRPNGYTWHGMTTFPREISWQGGRMIRRPVEEVKRLRKSEVKIHARIDHNTRFNGINGRTLDLTVTLKRGNYRFLYFLLPKRAILRFLLLTTGERALSHLTAKAAPADLPIGVRFPDSRLRLNRPGGMS